MSNPRSNPGSTRASRLEAELRRQAGSHTRLSPEEERALLERRDEDAIDTLVKHNLDLVVAQAEGHLDRGLDFSDLYQEGAVGLVDAVTAYADGGDFRKFASLHIGLQMDSLIDAEAGARREAEADVDDTRALDLAQAAFMQRERRPATDQELADILGWDAARYERVRAMLERAREENDAATLTFLDEGGGELGIDFLDDEPPPDPRRRLPGAGPDD
jgi:DNA-directed RNA polymerase sigma subunit (sigma70/sigma32)